MLTPSQEIIQLLAAFAPLFTQPTFQKVLVLVYGAILTPGKRTVTAALRVLGRDAAPNCGKYHRVLNHAVWSPLRLSRILLGLLVKAFVPSGTPLVFVVDETLERRAGKQIVYKGWFRDAVRSTGNKVAVSLGIRWCCVCLLVCVPWATRPWALPFLCVPVLSEKTCTRLNKPHRSGVAWTIWLLSKLRAWYPDAAMTLLGDGGYAAVELVAACQELDIRLVSRLRLDAGLYDFPAPQPKSKRGPKPKKGVRQPGLAAGFADPKTVWCQAVVAWYGSGEKTIGYRTGVSLWYTPGQNPVPLCWVLVRYEETNSKTGKGRVHGALFFSSDTTRTPEEILACYVGRWNIEVTFEEVRAHLGLETQRQWSRRAIGRTTPCLLGLFSLVVLMAQRLYPTQLPLQQAHWYRKEEATFSDVLGAVRSHLWSAMNYTHSATQPELCLIPRAIWNRLQQVAWYTA